VCRSSQPGSSIWLDWWFDGIWLFPSYTKMINWCI
jgi:hypothetical protein